MEQPIPTRRVAAAPPKTTDTLPGRSSVFISANRDTDTSWAYGILESAGISPLAWSDVPAGANWSAALIDMLRKTSGVIAFAADARSGSAVLLEVGVALGLGKPVILVVEDSLELSNIPLPLRGFPSVTVTQNIEAAAARLAAILDDNVGTELRGDFFTPREIVDVRNEGSIEHDVATALATAGARVAPQIILGQSQRVDLAAWFSDLLAPALNPVIVEIGKAEPNEGAALSQLRSYLKGSRLVLGMVVVPGNKKPAWQFEANTAIVQIGAAELIGFEPVELRAMLTYGRNRLMHGIS